MVAARVSAERYLNGDMAHCHLRSILNETFPLTERELITYSLFGGSHDGGKIRATDHPLGDKLCIPVANEYSPISAMSVNKRLVEVYVHSSEQVLTFLGLTLINLDN